MCTLATIHVPAGVTSISINHPVIQSYIACAKGAFTDNVDGILPANMVTVIGGPDQFPNPQLPAPTSFTVVPAGTGGSSSWIGFKGTDSSANNGFHFTGFNVVTP
jgi:hypothetical protein